MKNKFSVTEMIDSHHVIDEIESMKDLISLMKQNINAITDLRKIDKKADRINYDKIKYTIPCITINASFNNYVENKNCKDFSGYMFLDIDEGDIENQKKELFEKHSDKIVALGKSAGGKGIFFYIKLKNYDLLTPANFLQIQNYIISTEFKNFKIDNNCKGLARLQVLTTDENVYYNEELDNNKDLGYDLRNVQLGIVPPILKKKELKEIHMTPTIPNYTFIPFDKVLKNINTISAKPNCPFDKEYIIQDWEFFSLRFKKIINDGDKHKVFKRILSSLIGLNTELCIHNENLACQYFYSYLFFINKNYTNGNPMQNYKLKILITNYFSFLKKNNFNVKGKIRRVVINENIDKEYRKIIGCKAYGVYRKNKTTEKIKEAIKSLIEKNTEPTQSKVIQTLQNKISAMTIKKYWKEIINEMKINKLTTPEKIEAALTELKNEKFSYKKIMELTGLSRMTIHNYINKMKNVNTSTETTQPATQITKPIKYMQTENESLKQTLSDAIPMYQLDPRSFDEEYREYQIANYDMSNPRQNLKMEFIEYLREKNNNKIKIKTMQFQNKPYVI